ncbi:MAG: TylF/MycF/NovP-related O-methyltransferase [Desulforhopalus sp.]
MFRAIIWLFKSTSKRRRVRHELARLSAALFGDYYLGDDYKIWRGDKQFREKFFELSPLSPYSEERKYALREFARYTSGLSGEMAECGCYVGVSAWFMAQASPNKQLYLFDSFEGLSTPGKCDKPDDGVQVWEKGDLQTSEDILRNNLKEYSNIQILKGWIPTRFPEVNDTNFTLVHIDVDLYQPTLDSLNFFYERLTPGGVIVLDDYGYLTCPGAYKAANDFMVGKPEYLIHLPTGQGVIIRTR